MDKIGENVIAERFRKRGIPQQRQQKDKKDQKIAMGTVQKFSRFQLISPLLGDDPWLLKQRKK